MKTDITLEDAKLFMKHKVTQVPIGTDEQYYKVLITLPVDQTSSLTGSFVVTAVNCKQAQDKCVDYALQMKEIDDLRDGINWQMESANNLDKVGSYKFSIIIGAATAEDFISQYFEHWDDFVKTDGYARANSRPRQNDTSFLSEWKWPVISIPIIISIIYLLEYISNR